MIYRSLADLVFILHFCFVIFIIFGGLLTLRWRPVLWLHFPALAWGILVELFQLPCPLTNLEKWFKELGGESGYKGGFIEYYISAILYAELTPQFQMTLGILLFLFNLVVYLYVFRKPKFLTA
jgi:hypothetical protein